MIALVDQLLGGRTDDTGLPERNSCRDGVSGGSAESAVRRLGYCITLTEESSQNGETEEIINIVDYDGTPKRARECIEVTKPIADGQNREAGRKGKLSSCYP